MRDISVISIIIPCRNEEKFIAECLDGLLAQSYSKEKMEIFVVDGMSVDQTKEIVAHYQKSYPFINLIENEKKVTPVAMNIGINRAKGDCIFFMGAHAEYDVDYVTKCVAALQRYGADNVGGIMKVVPQNNSLISQAIAYVISSFFGAGNAYYKTKTKKEITEVDTVFGGCYKKEVFKNIGLFDERLIRNQDLEFNIRLRNHGGKIILVPDIVSYYYPKADLWDFARHNFNDGFWVVYPLKFGLKTFSWRHLLPFVFSSGIVVLGALGFINIIFWKLLGVCMLAYIFLDVLFSVKAVVLKKNGLLFFPVFIVFFLRHFFYGLGSLWALVSVKFKK